MKRTGIKRGTSRLTTRKLLQAKTELRRTTPLRATAGSRVRSVAGVGSPTGQSKPKRAKVTPEERAARKAVRARSGGTCEVCGRAPATNYQHRKNKSQMGGWCPSNGLDVCGMGNATGCHGAIHQNPRVAYERGWSVRSAHDPSRSPVWLAGRGWSYLTSDGSVVPTERSAA